MLETITQTKICTKCKETKSILLFSVKKESTSGLRNSCKDCDKQYRILNQEKINKQRKEFRDLNKEKVRKQKRDSYMNNKETSLAYQKKNYIKLKLYREVNKQRNNERNKLYYIKNRDKILPRLNAYIKSDIGKAIALNIRHKRRAIKKDGDVSGLQLLNIKKSTKNCYWCNCSLKKVKVHLDHYIPLSKGGLHTLSNLVISCAKCNLQKNAKDPIEFANSIGKLL